MWTQRGHTLAVSVHFLAARARLSVFIVLSLCLSENIFLVLTGTVCADLTTSCVRQFLLVLVFEHDNLIVLLGTLAQPVANLRVFDSPDEGRIFDDTAATFLDLLASSFILQVTVVLIRLE